MLDMLRNLRKNLGYGRKELSEIIRQVGELERRNKTLYEGYQTQMNTIELQRLEIERLKASNELKAREILMLKRERGDG